MIAQVAVNPTTTTAHHR